MTNDLITRLESADGPSRELDNPPAFPAGWPEAGYEPHYGMTLRDWFAGQALNAIITVTSAGQHDPIREGRDTEAGMAHDAYSLADAMLAERQKAQEWKEALRAAEEREKGLREAGYALLQLIGPDNSRVYANDPQVIAFRQALAGAKP